jgi:hypothetical protein
MNWVTADALSALLSNSHYSQTSAFGGGRWWNQMFLMFLCVPEAENSFHFLMPLSITHFFFLICTPQYPTRASVHCSLFLCPWDLQTTRQTEPIKMSKWQVACEKGQKSTTAKAVGHTISKQPLRCSHNTPGSPVTLAAREVEIMRTVVWDQSGNK